MNSKKINSKEKLAYRVLRSLSIRVSVIVLLSSIVSYMHLYSTIEEGAVRTLEEYIGERTEKESFVFEQARKNHVYLKQLIDSFIVEDKGKGSKAKKFLDFFEKREDKTYRNKAGYDGSKMAGLFLPPDYNLSEDKKSLIVYLKELAENLGPAFRANFQDTYFTTPENAMIIYWPEVPNWTMEMASDFNMLKEEYVWIADEEHNPERKMVWTGLFYDKVGKVWMTSGETPVYHNDKHLLTIGHDVTLSELLTRGIEDKLPGTYNVIFRKDGRLILHPDKITELKEREGYYDINKSNDTFIKDLVKSVLALDGMNSVIEHISSKHLLAFGKIKGPDWYFVTVYPRSLITSTALKGILFVILLAFLSLVLEVYLLWVVIKKEISEPIEELFDVTVKMTEGNLKTEIHFERDDELGVFAKTFDSMAKAIAERDSQLQDYTHTLEKKVEERTLELDKQRARTVETAKMASLGEMAGGIAHEINNPLMVISGSATLISKSIKKDEIDIPKIENFTKKILTTVDRIETIVNGLRTFSRSGKQDEFQMESLDSIIKETLSFCEMKLKQFEVSLEYESKKDISIECQKIQLSQVLINLISNAVDEIKDFEGKKWVRVNILEDETYVSIRIEDCGGGIPQNIQEKMFQPFFTTKDIGSGTGIGLSISTGIVKSHHGRLYVDNEVDNTCLVVKLPKKQP